MNEPHFGLIGVPDLRSHDHLLLQRGVMPSPAQAIFLANGFAQDCPDFGTPMPTLPPLKVEIGSASIRQGATVWREECNDVWRAHGVWDVDKDGNPRILRPGHFARADFTRDYLKPFIERFAASHPHSHARRSHLHRSRTIRSAPPKFAEADKLVYAPHFYDGMPPSSPAASIQISISTSSTAARSSAKRASALTSASRSGAFDIMPTQALGDVPIVIGECGIPMDLNGARSLSQRRFLSASRRRWITICAPSMTMPAKLHPLELFAGQYQRARRSMEQRRPVHLQPRPAARPRRHGFRRTRPERSRPPLRQKSRRRHR